MIYLKHKKSPEPDIKNVAYTYSMSQTYLKQRKICARTFFILYYVARVHVAPLYFKSFMCTSLHKAEYEIITQTFYFADFPGSCFGLQSGWMPGYKSKVDLNITSLRPNERYFFRLFAKAPGYKRNFDDQEIVVLPQDVPPVKLRYEIITSWSFQRQATYFNSVTLNLF